MLWHMCVSKKSTQTELFTQNFDRLCNIAINPGIHKTRAFRCFSAKHSSRERAQASSQRLCPVTTQLPKQVDQGASKESQAGLLQPDATDLVPRFLVENILPSWSLR